MLRPGFYFWGEKNSNIAAGGCPLEVAWGVLLKHFKNSASMIM